MVPIYGLVQQTWIWALHLANNLIRQPPAARTLLTSDARGLYAGLSVLARSSRVLAQSPSYAPSNLTPVSRVRFSPRHPPAAGMRLMPEDERLETLEVLKKNREEVDRAIQQLPLRIETPSAIRRKEDLERRLREIEDAIKIFSRPKVLVHL